MQYDETCLEYFLAHQEQLLPEPVAETMEEAEEFLEDCMAVVCMNLKEVCNDSNQGSFHKLTNGG